MSLERIKRFANPENHPYWKGEKAGYSALHKWVSKYKKKPRNCSQCGMVGRITKDGRNYIQWANKSHRYKRDLDDWIALCAACHGVYDSKK